MNIDWFTFLAQIINFLILVLLLRWFLYGPIVRAMRQREEKIGAELKLAEQQQQEGDSQVQRYEQRIREFDQQRDALLLDARLDSDERRKVLAKEARDEVQRKREQWLQAFERERETLLAQVQQQIGQLSATATRQVLMELADESLEQRMIQSFIRNLQLLDDAQREKIQGFLEDSTNTVVIGTAFEVNEDGKDLLRDAIGQEFGYGGVIEFETDAELICGIEFNAGGFGFGWNISEFLRTMEADFDSRLKTRTGYH